MRLPERGWLKEMMLLIENSDGEFKLNLNAFTSMRLATNLKLVARLHDHSNLIGDRIALAHTAIVPFESRDTGHVALI